MSNFYISAEKYNIRFHFSSLYFASINNNIVKTYTKIYRRKKSENKYSESPIIRFFEDFKDKDVLIFELRWIENEKTNLYDLAVRCADITKEFKK